MGLTLAAGIVVAASGTPRGALWRALPVLLLTLPGAYESVTISGTPAVGTVAIVSTIVGLAGGFWLASRTWGSRRRAKQAT